MPPTPPSRDQDAAARLERYLSRLFRPQPGAWQTAASALSALIGGVVTVAALALLLSGESAGQTAVNIRAMADRLGRAIRNTLTGGTG